MNFKLTTGLSEVFEMPELRIFTLFNWDEGPRPRTNSTHQKVIILFTFQVDGFVQIAYRICSINSVTFYKLMGLF
jgi:hypothetical protein